MDTVSTTATTLIFFLTGGSLNEALTVSLQIGDTLGEVKNDTINFNVIAP